MSVWGKSHGLMWGLVWGGVEIVTAVPDQLRLTLELHQSFGVQVVLHKSLGLQSDLHKSIQLTLER